MISLPVYTVCCDISDDIELIDLLCTNSTSAPSHNIEVCSNELNNIDPNNLVTVLSKSTNKHFPKRRISRKQYKLSKTPWISSDILGSIKQGNKLYANYLKCKCSL